jgi:hypothetical protein
LFLERLVEAYQAGDLKFFGEHQALTDASALPGGLASDNP